ncbi:helix-turn-helix domain-containing protein [Dyadobacter pollutisoli]|jgi:AraC-like DNA-binding protein|uniref:Helix-turn-helix domain-containing protein n=1 Tax=Dyadobacter pollutisoli TaxID=2910158 RepID=A0A9E8SP62_9BACT|nr:helix-turn-helix domain-containing protein [Dyadobacter pollutisoli]WAC15059.1 helix-turn-helix domain-containing protein [Dyadobacter pollutisoli]
MPKKTDIPLHYLSDDSVMGIAVHKIERTDDAIAMDLGVHRDNHGNFFFQEKGYSCLMVDFREVRLHGCGVFCILPGQVHYLTDTFDATGWFLATDMTALDEWQRAVVEEYAQNGMPVCITEQQSETLSKSLSLLSDISKSSEDHKQIILQNMLKVCLSVFACLFESEIRKNPSGNLRPAIITSEFRKLLAGQYKTVKSPAAYAAAMNISPSYLNEAVKETTGQSVSHWIQNEVIMESKRLLYYTNLSVKEISFSLGYEDHTYFSRLFRKVTGKSPGQFRDEYRE